MNLPLYSQGSPEWRDVVIGRGADGSLTVGSHGCLLSCLSMSLAAYGLSETPATLVSKAKIQGGVLDIEGNLAWDGIERIFPAMAFLERKYTTNKQGNTADGSPKVQSQVAIERIKLLLLMGQPVPLEVFTPNGQHFILAKLWGDTRKDFLCNDPNGGIEIWFKDRYGPLETKLMGWIISVGPTAWFPANSTPERQQMGLSLGYAQLSARGKDTKANALRAAEALLR